MNSLEDLNNRGATAFEFPDTRPSGVVFDRVPSLYELDRAITIESTTPDITPNVEIEEIVNYATADVELEITVNDITSTVSWSALSDNLTLTQVGDTYTITGFQNVTDWESARAFTWNLPANWADDPYFWLDVRLSYYVDETDTTETLSWIVYDPNHYYIQGAMSASSSVSLTIEATVIRFFTLLFTKANPGTNTLGFADGERSVAINSDRFAVGDYTANKVYVYDASTGNLERTINNPNLYMATTDDRFGYSVDMSSTRIAVGAPFEDTSGENETGKVYVFNSSTGNLERTISHPEPGGQDLFAGPRFGLITFVTEDYIIASAPNEAINYQETPEVTADFVGKVYIFSASTGTLLHTIQGPEDGVDTYVSQSFGLIMDADETRIAVGDPLWEATNAAGPSFNRGRVTVYNISTGSLEYTIINPANDDTGFGDFVAINGDWLAVASTATSTRIYYQGNYARTISNVGPMAMSDDYLYINGKVYNYKTNNNLLFTFEETHNNGYQYPAMDPSTNAIIASNSISTGTVYVYEKS